MTDAPERIWTRQTSGWGELQRGVYQNAKMDGYEYIRADLARPTVAEAAKVLLNMGPAIRMKAWEASAGAPPEFGRYFRKALRALSEGGE